MDGLLCELIYNQILKSMWKTKEKKENITLFYRPQSLFTHSYVAEN